MRRTLLAVFAVFTMSMPVSAQIGWDGPALVSPGTPAGLSLFLLEAAGGDLGALATFRHAAGPVGMGYRFGVAEESGPDGDLAIAGGFDVSGFLSRAVEGSEVDLMWWSGGGIGVGSETLVTVPLGLMLGWTGGDDDVRFSPYGGGHHQVGAGGQRRPDRRRRYRHRPALPVGLAHPLRRGPGRQRPGRHRDRLPDADLTRCGPERATLAGAPVSPRAAARPFGARPRPKASS